MRPSEFWARLAAMFRRDALDRDLDEELASHVAMAADEDVRRGVAPGEARRRALARLGGTAAARQHHRDARGLPALDALLQDLRYSLRGLRRSPAFTATAIATLAVGIGVNAAVFTVANAVLFKGFRGIDGNDRLLYIGTQRNNGGCCVSYPDLLDWRARLHSFEGLGAMADLRVSVSDGTGFPETYSATQLTANSFQLLGRQPILGRDFTPADEAPGAAPVAILRHDFWQRRYGGDPAIVGRVIRVNGTPTTIVGVMPPDFSFPQNQQIWLPLVPTPAIDKREARGLWFAFGRMADGVTFESARAELETVGQQLAAAYPRTNEGWVPRPRTFAEFFVGKNAVSTYRTLWGAVGFVLLIACANVANLMLARAVGRSREVSLRVALGASRWRIVRQLLVESLLLSAAGGLAGWWLARGAVRVYASIATPPTAVWAANLLDYAMDGRVLAYLIATSVGTGLLFGLAPALRLSRLDVNTALKDGGRGAAGAGGGRRRLSSLVVVGEMTLAVVLLAGAGVMMRSFANVYTADLGIDPRNVTSMFIGLRDARYDSPEAKVAFHDRLLSRLAAIPGVESVTAANSPPTGAGKVPYEIAGAPPTDAERRPTVSMSAVSSGYFHTLGAAVRAGREFTEFDGATGMPVAIVNARLAALAWPGKDPLGQRLRLFTGETRGEWVTETPGEWVTVVGVVADIRLDPSRSATLAFEPRVYLPYRQRPSSGTWIFVRSGLPLGSLTTSFRQALQALDPDLPIWMGPFTLEEQVASSGASWDIANHAVLFAVFAAIALLLAAVGLYSVLAHAVGQRTQEIGVRLAMGGTARDIRRLVLRQGLAPVVLGLALGLAASVAVTRLLSAELVEVSPVDPAALAGATAVLIAAALLGCLVPARRAMRVDPVEALRHD